MKCNFCEDEMEEIIIGDSRLVNTRVWLNSEEAYLFVCISRDCKNRGVVIAIPSKLKEE